MPRRILVLAVFVASLAWFGAVHGQDEETRPLQGREALAQDLKRLLHLQAESRRLQRRNQALAQSLEEKTQPALAGAVVDDSVAEVPESYPFNPPLFQREGNAYAESVQAYRDKMQQLEQKHEHMSSRNLELSSQLRDAERQLAELQQSLFILLQAQHKLLQKLAGEMPDEELN